jgi:hypothetical protein
MLHVTKFDRTFFDVQQYLRLKLSVVGSPQLLGIIYDIDQGLKSLQGYSIGSLISPVNPYRLASSTQTIGESSNAPAQVKSTGTATLPVSSANLLPSRSTYTNWKMQKQI